MNAKLTNLFLTRWAVLLLIIASGSFYFQVLRMPLTFSMMMITAFLIVVTNSHVLKKNMSICILILSLLAVNVVLNIQRGLNVNDLVITCGKFIFLIVLMSNLSFSSFKGIYVRMMVGIAILSLACFLWVDIFALGKLPLQTINYSDAGLVNLTPYYTIGWSRGAFGRNAGPFGEPGSYQIFLNIALVYLMLSKSTEELFTEKEKNVYTIILVATVLTTMSATGYICLALVVLASLFQGDNSSEKSKRIKILAVIALVVLYTIEEKNGFISEKLSGGGSYNVRSNDTFGGLAIAFTRPFVGYGLFQTSRTSLLASQGIGMISNGLVSLMISIGIPLTICYLWCIYSGMKKNMQYGIFTALCVFLFYFLALSAEGGALNLIYLINLLVWKEEKQAINVLQR